MAKKIVSRVDRNLTRRLREARREVGLSTRAVAEKLPRKLAISHTTLASYEKGSTVPPVDILAALADIYGRPLNWFLENRVTLESFRYRNLKSRVRLSDQRQFEALAGKWTEAYLNLDKLLMGHPSHQAKSFCVYEDVTPNDLAKLIRTEFLDLDDKQPVQNMVHVLESFSAWAIEVKSTFGIDGASARFGHEHVVVLNPGVSNERVRMNVAYELAHVLYNGCRHRYNWSDTEIGQRAYEFASSLLIPATQLKAAFADKSFLGLIQYKEKFGISLVAMIYMAEKDRIINSTTSRWLWTEMTRRGWRQNEPGYVWRDRAISFEIMLESGIYTKKLTWADAERITGVRQSELQNRIDEATQVHPLSDRSDRPMTIHSLRISVDTDPHGTMEENERESE